jgi:arsenite-transporting ATPase
MEHLMSLREAFEKNPDRRYIMFGGKGGLGKTTFSAATAYWLARQGYKVLVFSVDPQASLSDIFKRDIFGKGPVEIMPTCTPRDRPTGGSGSTSRKSAEDPGYVRLGRSAEEIENYIQAAAAEPAMEESAIFDEVVDIVVGGKYDYYIYDLVPLGHALYYLSMASVYDEWIDKITALRSEMQEYSQVAAVMQRNKQSEEDQILQELQYIKTRINKSSGILTDKQKTAFYFVVVPEEMIILDTHKAAGLFAKFDVPLAGYIVNRVIPPELATQDIPDYLRNVSRCRSVLARSTGFANGWPHPGMERDITGLPMIERWPPRCSEDLDDDWHEPMQIPGTINLRTLLRQRRCGRPCWPAPRPFCARACPPASTTRAQPVNPGPGRVRRPTPVRGRPGRLRSTPGPSRSPRSARRSSGSSSTRTSRPRPTSSWSPPR